METVAAALGDDVDLAATELAVFCVEVTGQNPKLSDRIEIRNNRRSHVDVLFTVTSIDTEEVCKFALTIDRDGPRIQGAGGVQNGCADILHCFRGDGCLGRHARLQRKQVRITSPIQGDRAHLPPGDHLAKLRALGLDVQRVVIHGNNLRNAP